MFEARIYLLPKITNIFGLFCFLKDLMSCLISLLFFPDSSGTSFQLSICTLSGHFGLGMKKVSVSESLLHCYDIAASTSLEVTGTDNSKLVEPICSQCVFTEAGGMATLCDITKG